MSEKPNILVVDDELGPRESLKMILKPTYNVYTAENGIKALETIKKTPIDVMTLDLRMPELGGLDVLKEAKKINENIEIIIITGYGTLETVTSANQNGAYDFLSKPFDVGTVLSVVQKSLRKKKKNLEIKKILEEIGSIGGTSKIERLKKIFEKSGQMITHFKSKGHSAANNNGDTAGDINFVKFLKILSHILESKTPFLAEHSEKIYQYSSLLCSALKTAQTETREIEIASYFHDIGKMVIDMDLSSNMESEDGQKYQLWKQHPERGLEVLEPLNLSSNINAIVLHHHENYNGQGFPSGLKGEEIPLGARILRIANAYDALLTATPHPETFSQKKILNDLMAYGNGHLDPYLLQVFIRELDSQQRSTS